MRPLRPLALLAVWAATLSPALAAITPTVPTAPEPQAELRVAISGAIERGSKDDCAGSLALLDPLVPRLSPGDERTAVQRLRLACLGQAGRLAELAAVQRELAVVIPSDGLVRGFGVLIALAEGHHAAAAEQLAVLAEEDPRSLTMISGEQWRGIAQKLTEEQRFALRDRVFVALARADWQPADQPDMRDALAQGAIEALLTRNEVDEAAALLPRVEVPELLYAMATERLYASLWPRIETRLGANMGRAIDRFAAARLDDFASRPDDPRARRDAIRAFLLLGRYAEAIELAQPIPIADGMDEDAVASVRYESQALAALGQRGAAVDRLRGFSAIDPARTPEAVSGLVGLAELLDEDGRAADALAASRQSLARAGDALSPWGRAWLRRTEACALSELGRTSEANAAGDALKAAAAENQPATIEALLCLKRDNEAAALAIATLATSEGASTIADQFQPDGAIWAPAGSHLRAQWARLLARPDVKAAFGKRARILPKPLWPDADRGADRALARRRRLHHRSRRQDACRRGRGRSQRRRHHRARRGDRDLLSWRKRR